MPRLSTQVAQAVLGAHHNWPLPMVHKPSVEHVVLEETPEEKLTRIDHLFGDDTDAPEEHQGQDPRSAKETYEAAVAAQRQHRSSFWPNSERRFVARKNTDVSPNCTRVY